MAVSVRAKLYIMKMFLNRKLLNSLKMGKEQPYTERRKK